MYEGITVIVEMIGAFVLFVVTKEEISPVPETAKPEVMLSFDQL